MKNKSINALIAVLLAPVFPSGIYVSVLLAGYGVWLSDKVLKNKTTESKRDVIIAQISRVIGALVFIIGVVMWFYTYRSK